MKTNTTKSIQELVQQQYSLIKNGTTNELFIRTGFATLDDFIGGFYPGEFVVIAGHPAMGISRLLVQLSLNISVSHPVLFYSLSASESQIGNSFLSAAMKISPHRLKTNTFSEQEKKQLHNNEVLFKDKQLVIDFQVEGPFSSFLENIKQRIKKDNIKVIAIDYLQLMVHREPYYKGSSSEELSMIATGLKQLAVENNIVIIAISALSRTYERWGESTQPRLSDISGSNYIKICADKIIFVVRPEYYGIIEDECGYSLKNIANFFIAKNASGYIGSVKLGYDSSLSRFYDNGLENPAHTHPKNIVIPDLFSSI